VIEARMQLKLPMHFQIYPISDRVHDTTAPFSIAFGQSALLLDLVAPRLKIKDGIHIA
jgi:CRISPR-associated endonuclease/helicase Cas3